MDDITPKLQKALVLGFEGDFESALVALTELITSYPDNLDVRYELAMTQFMLGLIDEGCGNLKKILLVDPTHEKAVEQSAYC